MNFDELYGKLNTEQKEAVDTTEGPVMVIAGPGTGKTQILALRIAHILRKKLAEPEEILALTYSEAGVIAMRRRLGELLGHQGYYVPVNTFHGFCNDIIARYPDEFPRIGKGEHMGEVVQIELLENLIDEGGFSLLRPFGRPDFYISSARATISSLKREGVLPEELAKLIKKEEKAFLARDDLYHTSGSHKGKMKGMHQDTKKNIEKNKEFARLYGAYQERLLQDGRYDYDDMILFVLHKMRGDDDFFVRIADRVRYVLVDEHQDTNNAQNKLLQMLAEQENPNIFVVGDEKQAIYRFQGASLENFLYFHTLFPKAKLIVLHTNYRSGQNLLDNALKMIANNNMRIGNIITDINEELRTSGERTMPEVVIREVTHELEEDEHIAEHIAKLMDNGADPVNIAILVREHKDAAPIAHALDRRGIAYVWDYPQTILSDVWAQKMMRILRLLDDMGNQEKLLAALHVDTFGIPPVDIYNLFAKREESRAIERVRTRFDTWHTRMHNEPPIQVYGAIVRDGGFLSFVTKGNIAALQGLRGLFQMIRRYSNENPRATLADILAYIDRVDAYGIRIKMHAQAAGLSAPRIMTVHGSKGLEFDYVFLPRLHDAKWGGRKRPEHIKLPKLATTITELDRYEDERRLFFVGLTRSRNAAYISFADESEDGKQHVPSIFLDELGLPIEKIKTDGLPLPISVGGSDPPTAVPDEGTKAWVADLFYRRGLSVTALNNYIECPWKYFYRNLLQVPSAPSKQQLYGIAVHTALNHFFTQARGVPGTPRGTPRRALVGVFENSLNKQVLSERDFIELRDRGRAALALWFDTYNGSWNYHTENECSLTLPLNSGLRLTGKIDKIEFNGKNAVVVDYKTGKPKTRGEIEGKTKNSTGALKRQLIFYKLLVDESRRYPHTMAAGELDFIEPDARGQLRKERFEITAQEVEDLKKEIMRAADEIMTLTFWGTRCDKKDCEWCALRTNS